MRNSTAFFLLSVAMTAPLQGMATTKNTLSVAQSNDSMQSFSFRPGFIDGQMIAFNTKECKIEMNSCKEKQDNFFKEMQQKEQELILGHNELAAKQSTLTGPALKKEQKKLVEKERKAKEEFEEGKLELQTELLEATEKVNGVITKTAIQFAHANGLSMVQDKNTGQIYYLDPKFDLSNQFMDFMNMQYDEKMASAAKKKTPQTPSNKGKAS